MSKGIPAQQGCYAFTVAAGQEYWWCACGGSRTQPFCDGLHNSL